MISYIVLTLIALLILIGIIQTWQDNKMFIIIPIVLFGLIFYFLKRPPAFLSKESKTRGTYQSAVRQSKAKRSALVQKRYLLKSLRAEETIATHHVTTKSISLHSKKPSDCIARLFAAIKSMTTYAIILYPFPYEFAAALPIS